MAQGGPALWGARLNPISTPWNEMNINNGGCSSLWAGNCGRAGRATVYTGDWRSSGLTDTGSYWQLLSTAGSYWQLLAANDNCWQLLAATGSYWQLLGSNWRLLVVISY